MNSVCRSILRPRATPLSRSLRRVTWKGLARVAGLIGAGCCIVLAVIGAFLPLLPTTPFVLLASYLLCRSCPELHYRFRQSRLFGGLLADWEERGGIRGKDKLRAVTVLLICSCVTLYAGNLSQTQTCIFLALVAAGLVVILRIPMVRD
jgi:uncharacterized membrane protein YbaN (DUF454 family)